MPGQSTGGNHKPRTQSHHMPRSRADGYRSSRTCSHESGSSQESARDHHDAVRRQPHQSHNDNHRAHPRHFNARGSETIGFIPGSADGPQGTSACGSWSWSGCRALLCCILTCGFYSTPEPCLPANESSTDEPTKSTDSETRSASNGMALLNPTCNIPMEPHRQPPCHSDSFRYPDLRIGGKEVVYPSNFSGPPKRSRTDMKTDSHKERPISNTSVYSRETLDLDDLDDSGTDIDSLIRKKLLELYKLHQIDQLAKCTSDSSFSRKTNEISDLIYSIAQDYNLEEQEAESRLVHGVIRISTRKSKGKNRDCTKGNYYISQEALAPNGRRDGTLPDSGNETMTFSEIEPEVKVSEQTSSDKLARDMRLSSERTFSSGSATVYLPSHDTDSSGVPLLYYR